MLWSSRVTCAVCGVAVPRAQATRTRVRRSAAVCRTCLERWKRSRRVCVKCHAPVRRSQFGGLLAHLHGLGHAECGAAVLAGAALDGLRVVGGQVVATAGPPVRTGGVAASASRPPRANVAAKTPNATV